MLPPLAFRALIWIHTDLPLRALDLRGVLSDVASGLLVASALMTAARGHRWLPRVLLALWIAICLGDAEHILANGSHLRAAYAGYLTHSTFLLGSVFRTGFPAVAAAVVVAAALGAWWAGRIEPHQRLPVRSTLGTALLLYLISLGWTLDIARAEWRQISLMEAQVRQGGQQAAEPPCRSGAKSSRPGRSGVSESRGLTIHLSSHRSVSNFDQWSRDDRQSRRDACPARARLSAIGFRWSTPSPERRERVANVESRNDRRRTTECVGWGSALEPPSVLVVCPASGRDSNFPLQLLRRAKSALSR